MERKDVLKLGPLKQNLTKRSHQKELSTITGINVLFKSQAFFNKALTWLLNEDYVECTYNTTS